MDTVTKICRKCGVEKPYSEMKHSKNRPDGIDTICKQCHTFAAKKYRADHLEHMLQYERAQYQKHIDKKRESNRRRNRENRHSLARKISIQKYWRLHKAEINQRNKSYRTNNLEKARLQKRQFHLNNPGYYHARTLMRRALKRNLPNLFTKLDWQRAITYFNGCCAVCGRQGRDLFGTHTLAADHWIPLTDKRPDNPGTVPHNIIPLCHGEKGCNNKKSNKHPESWLTEQFGKRKAKIIIGRILAYFEWIKTQREN